MWPAKIFQKIRFNVGRLFLKHLQRTPPVAASQGWYDHRKLSVYVSISFFLNLWSYIDFCFWNSNQLASSCWKSTMEIPKTMCEICVTLTKTIPERRQPLFPLKSSENLENLWFFDDSRGIEIDFVLLSYC